MSNDMQGPDFWKQFLTFISAVAATFVGFALNQTWQKKKEVRDRLRKLIAQLGGAEAELEICARKLTELVTKLEGDTTCEVGGIMGVVVPSCDFNSIFLEKLKGALIDHLETAELVRHLAECQYDLEHVQGKLDSYKKTAENVGESGGEASALGGMALNAGALRGLAKETCSRFTVARDRVLARQTVIQKQLAGLERSVIGWLLKE